MKAYLLHATTCEIRLVHNLYHLFSLTSGAEPCSTYKNTQKLRRFRLKSGSEKIPGGPAPLGAEKNVHNLDISANLFEMLALFQTSVLRKLTLMVMVRIL